MGRRHMSYYSMHVIEINCLHYFILRNMMAGYFAMYILPYCPQLNTTSKANFGANVIKFMRLMPHYFPMPGILSIADRHTCITYI